MIPRSVNEQNAELEDLPKLALSRMLSTINCCLPGIVDSFCNEKNTVNVQPAVRKRIRTQSGVFEMDYPLLTDVPVLFIGGGGYNLTFPVRHGDGCLVLFCDSCIDAWWQSGGVQGQIIARQHDLSDGIAIVGLRAAPQAIQGIGAVPAIADLVIAGKQMSEWMARVETALNLEG